MISRVERAPVLGVGTFAVDVLDFLKHITDTKSSRLCTKIDISTEGMAISACCGLGWPSHVMHTLAARQRAPPLAVLALRGTMDDTCNTSTSADA